MDEFSNDLIISYSHIHILFIMFPALSRCSPCGIVANMRDCDFLVSEFEIHYFYNVHFRTFTLEKNMNPLILQLWIK